MNHRSDDQGAQLTSAQLPADRGSGFLVGGRKNSSCLSTLGLIFWSLENCSGGHLTRSSLLSRGGERPCLLGKASSLGTREKAGCAPWTHPGGHVPVHRTASPPLKQTWWLVQGEAVCVGLEFGVGRSNYLGWPRWALRC